MNKSFAVGLAIGGAAAVAIGAGAVVGHKLIRSGARYARVVQVRPLTRSVLTPRQHCYQVAVTHRRAASDAHQIIGSVAGALVGGILGHQVGGGTGRDLATVAGAAAGGYAGNRIEARMQHGDTYTSQEHKCRTVYDRTVRSNGYEVRYRLDGKTGTVRMDHDPGQKIPVRNGHLVLNEARQAG